MPRLDPDQLLENRRLALTAALDHHAHPLVHVAPNPLGLMATAKTFRAFLDGDDATTGPAEKITLTVHAEGGPVSALEAQDAAAGAVAVAPRVTLEQLKAKILCVEYFTAGPMDLTTVCAISVANGFTFIGTAGCVSPENYNRELGQEIAHRNAMDQLWAAEGYLLADDLMAQRNGGRVGGA